MKPNRSQGEVYHQEIHRDRSEDRRSRGGQKLPGRAIGEPAAKERSQKPADDEPDYQDTQVKSGSVWPAWHQLLRSMTYVMLARRASRAAEGDKRSSSPS